jgi:purine-binding chemotaxis protein CheW
MNLSRRANQSNCAPIEMCSVAVGGTLLGVLIRHVLEILGGVRPQPVPLAPKFIGGLVHSRGDVLTTVSVRELLGLPLVHGPQDILVVESVSGNFGVLVDSVGKVLTVSVESYEPNPSTLNERCRNLFAGAYKLENELLVALDPFRLDPAVLSGTQES